MMVSVLLVLLLLSLLMSQSQLKFFVIHFSDHQPCLLTTKKEGELH